MGRCLGRIIRAWKNIFIFYLKMARKKIREHDAKRILKARFESLVRKTLPIQVAQVTGSTDYKDLLQQVCFACLRVIACPGKEDRQTAGGL